MSHQTWHRYEYIVKGLDCADCAKNLEETLARLPGVHSAHLVFATARLSLEAEMSKVLAKRLADTARELGYELVPGESVIPQSSKLNWLSPRPATVKVAVIGALLGAALIARWGFQAYGISDVLLIASIAAGGIPLLRQAFASLFVAHKIDMNVLMLIAVIGATALGEYIEGAVTLLLLTTGELLEDLSAERARQAISGVMHLAPSEAVLISEQGQRSVPTSQLRLNDLISVRPGERLPMDGVIVEGQSSLEEAAIMGEALPVEKTVGEPVYAGSINGQGALTVRVTRLSDDSTLSRIIKLVEQAQARQSNSERFVDKFAAIYTPVVVAIAVLIALVPPLLGLGAWRVWLYRALVPLVVACPCALVLSTPVTMVSGLARAAKSGVIIKGGAFLERLAQLRVVAFDKTGTLTVGKPQVVANGCAADHLDNNCEHCLDLIAKAASVESRSEHVLGKAVTAEAVTLGVAERYPVAESVQALPGRGISGQVNGHQIAVGSVSSLSDEDDAAVLSKAQAAQQSGNTVLVIRDTCCDESCYLTVADTLRPEAKQAIQQLAELGITRTIMLTGDNEAVAKRIAQEAGISEVHAGLLPEQKVEIVEKLVQEYGQVAMVGDGVNDAPALAAAYLGVAMGLTGTGVAVETADVSLLSDDLRRLPWAIKLARYTSRLVKMNVLLSLAIKLVFLVLAFWGITTLWMAVLADTGSSLLVTANGLRALRFQEPSETGFVSFPSPSAKKE